MGSCNSTINMPAKGLLRNHPRGTKESLHGPELQETVNARLMGCGINRTILDLPSAVTYPADSGSIPTQLRL